MTAVSETTGGGFRALRGNRNFRLLWVGQVLSDLGSQIGLLAYPLLVLALTHSAVIAGAVGTAASGAAFLVRLPAGAWADRADRRRMMMAWDALRAVALALLAALVATGAVVWPVILVVAVVDRIGDTFFTPAATAAMPVIVEDHLLESAWAASEGRQYAAYLIGAPLGGILYGLGRAIPFLADAVSYGISVLTSRGLRGDFASSAEAGIRRRLWAEAFEGLRLLWGDSLLRAVLIQAPLVNFAFTGSIFTLILGLRRNGSSATVIGVAEAVIMAGGLIGALIAPEVRRRASARQTILLLVVSGALLVMVAAAVMPSPLVAIPLAIPPLFSPAANAALFAAMLRQAPKHMHGRANNGLRQVADALAALAPLVSGIVIAQTSARWAMGLFALTLAAIIPLALILPAPRDEDTG